MSDLFESKKLTEQREAVVNEMHSLTSLVNKEGREFTSEELEKFDRMDAEQKKLADRIQTLQRVEHANKLTSKKETHEVREYRPNKPVTFAEQRDAFRAWALNGAGRGHSITRQMAEACERAGIGLHESRYVVQRDQSGDVTTEGGYLKSGSIFQGLEAKLLSFGGVRSVAQVKAVSNGVDIHYATRDTTTQKATIQAAENDQITNTSVAYGTLPISIYTWISGVFPVSLQLLQDASYPVEQDVNAVLSERFFRAWNEKYTLGDGSGEPYGVLDESEEGVEAAGTTAVTYDEIVDLYHSVDDAYRNNAKFMMADSTLAKLKKLVDGNERPIWGSGMLQDGTPDNIFGKAVIVNNDMPASTAGNKAILFGDFSKYLIVEAKDVQLLVLRESLLASNLAIGFLAYARTGARLLQPAAMKHLVMAAGGS